MENLNYWSLSIREKRELMNEGGFGVSCPLWYAPELLRVLCGYKSLVKKDFKILTDVVKDGRKDREYLWIMGSDDILCEDIFTGLVPWIKETCPELSSLLLWYPAMEIVEKEES